MPRIYIVCTKLNNLIHLIVVEIFLLEQDIHGSKRMNQDNFDVNLDTKHSFNFHKGHV